MKVLPFLLPARRPLLIAAIFSVAFVILSVLLVCSNSFWNPGVFWHTVSYREARPKDATLLLASFYLIEFVCGLVLSGGPSTGSVHFPADAARARFLLARPVTRTTVFVAPLLLSSLGILLIPILATLLPISWLALVHAPALHHLLAVAELIPDASAPNTHPGFSSSLLSLHLGRRYLAAVSLGLCVVTVLHAQRWLIFSSSPAIRRTASVARSVFYLLPLIPSARILAKPLVAPLLFLLNGRSTLTALPSDPSIVLHLAFVILLSLYTVRFMQELEL